MNKTELFQKSSRALNAYARFLERFGVLNVKSENPRVLRLRGFVKELREMGQQLNDLVVNSD